MSKLYCCYSVQLRNFLKNNGIGYEICGLNPNNNQMFWVYIRDDNLSQLLDKWSNLKH